jgi:hypothetical protein
MNLERKSCKTVFLGSQVFKLQRSICFVDSIASLRNPTLIPSIWRLLWFWCFS